MVATVDRCLTAPVGFKAKGIRAERGRCPENELPWAISAASTHRCALGRGARQPVAVINPVRRASTGEAELGWRMALKLLN